MRACGIRLYQDRVLSGPDQTIWSAIKEIGQSRFLVLGQFELYSKQEYGLFLEFFRRDKSGNGYNRGKLETSKHRQRATDPHLFGHLRISEEIVAAAAWICRSDEGQNYFHLTLL